MFGVVNKLRLGFRVGFVALCLSSLNLVASAGEVSTVTAAAPSWFETLVFPILMGLFFYLLIWRPQSKKEKAHSSLIGSINQGDEVVTTSGIMGKVVRLEENFLILDSGSSELILQKAAIAKVMPKGTMKSFIGR